MPTVLMTGGHSGLGLVGAQTLANRYKCDLILVGRNRERVHKGAQQLRIETGRNVDVLTMDLNSLASIREGVMKCKAALQAAKAWDKARWYCVQCRRPIQRTDNL